MVGRGAADRRQFGAPLGRAGAVVAAITTNSSPTPTKYRRQGRLNIPMVFTLFMFILGSNMSHHSYTFTGKPTRHAMRRARLSRLITASTRRPGFFRLFCGGIPISILPLIVFIECRSAAAISHSVRLSPHLAGNITSSSGRLCPMIGGFASRRLGRCCAGLVVAITALEVWSRFSRHTCSRASLLYLNDAITRGTGPFQSANIKREYPGSIAAK